MRETIATTIMLILNNIIRVICIEAKAVFLKVFLIMIDLHPELRTLAYHISK